MITNNMGSLDDHPISPSARTEHFEDLIAMDSLNGAEVLSHLDFEKYFELAQTPLPTSNDTTLRYMEREGLVEPQDDGSFAITNLGALLFARDMFPFTTVSRKALRVIRYHGTSRTCQRTERSFESGYAVVLESVFDQIVSMIGVAEGVEGVRRTSLMPYPEIAIREVLVNALVHQDLTMKGTGPLVEIFDERIEVTNPGTLLVDAERLVNDPPRSRNEKLSALMRRLGFCEEAGSGWDKIIESCEQFRNPAPRIYQRDSTKVTLFQPREYKMLTPEERLDACYWHACVRYERGGYISNASLRARFGLKSSNSAQISRLIKEAVDKSLIKPVDPDASPKYMRYQPFWA